MSNPFDWQQDVSVNEGDEGKTLGELLSEQAQRRAEVNADYELRQVGCYTIKMDKPARHGSASADWIDPAVPRGGAEEIAALREAIEEMSERYWKQRDIVGKFQELLKLVAEEKDL